MMKIKKHACSIKEARGRCLLFFKTGSEFCNTTSLHGMQHLVAPNRHILERVFWCVALLLAAGGAAVLMSGTWHRFLAHPTVVSMEKDFRNWNVSFPAITLCFQDKLDSDKARQVIAREWNVTEDSTQYQFYFDFLSTVANLSYYSLHNIKRFSNDSNLYGKNLRQLALDVNFDLTNCKLVVFDANAPLQFEAVFLEMGLCYTYGSVLAPLLSTTISSRSVINTTNMLHCNYLNSLCYGRVENLQRAISYYVHSGHEVPGPTSRAYTVLDREERDTTFRFLNIYSSDELPALSPRQRRCLFANEDTVSDVIGQHSSSTAYSVGLCEMQCRARLARRLCSCEPHFYTHLVHDLSGICDLRGLICIAEHSDALLRAGGECQCMPQCDTTFYQLDNDVTFFWRAPIPSNIRFRWAIEKYSKTRLRRDVIFGFGDLLVSIGGTAGLFLGCSLLTGAEVVYYVLIHMPAKCFNLFRQK